VLVVEVDVVDTEALERCVAGGPDVLGRAVDADAAAVGVALVAELGGELDLVPPAGDGLADELLVGEGAVSRNVTPRSSARWMVAMPCCSSVEP